MSYEGISWSTILTGYAFGQAISIANHQGAVVEGFHEMLRFQSLTWKALQMLQSNSVFGK